ncbi:helix-hairpin-helix domain-containing protein [Reichenbachiella agarivorans]|uniref:Helix-hairpin-helix domain-containing protein n=1 Tax=Reichenbachiella agarivorans TaxID=2979464 RepID=A0ABY6CSA1_9BACT|nr:helix-hairpin-helix domain-containing protein [Reichenbachiella agarivorans]UXP33214.1 helix-hairpin-helix domain-containing protein [Reichenbachiella agarivorans]
MSNPLKNYLRRYFGFTSTEIRGLFVLVPLLVFVLFIPQLYKSYLSGHQLDSSAKDQEVLDVWMKELKSQIKVTEDEDLRVLAKHFDPNLIDAEQWREMGFSESVSKRIEKYVTKGGRFKRKEDLLKIYGINTRLVKAYYDYMYFLPEEKLRINKAYQPLRNEQSLPVIPKKEQKEQVIYDLNLADTTELKTIRGIGSFWARKVVSHRERLGGFVDRMQVYEIDYMKDSVADIILEHTTFTVTNIRQLNMNTATTEELSTHPYINYKLANAIIKYRKQHGDYQSVDALKKIVILDEPTFDKIRPYLKVAD